MKLTWLWFTVSFSKEKAFDVETCNLCCHDCCINTRACIYIREILMYEQFSITIRMYDLSHCILWPTSNYFILVFNFSTLSIVNNPWYYFEAFPTFDIYFLVVPTFGYQYSWNKQWKEVEESILFWISIYENPLWPAITGWNRFSCLFTW